MIRLLDILNQMVYLGKNKRQRFSKKQLKAMKKQQLDDKKKLDEVFAAKKEEIIESKVEGPIKLDKVVTVRNFAEKLGVPATKVIEKLMQNGIMANINESIDFDTAEIIADEFKATVLEIKKEKIKSKIEHKNLKSRPPIVVVLGHVDHGKTTLLDAIRKTDIAAHETGGITQHIGAYQVTWKDKAGKKTLITFLDTPGHEAFSTMRAHGTNITDIAILVVAADDGVKPQTKEAISHIKAANIPVIVAINKIDRPEANVERVKRELGDYGLIPEEWGGKTVMVEISAKQQKGIDELLDMVLLTTDMKELKSQYDGMVEGVVIESHMQAGVGPVATILIQHGTLKGSDNLVIGGEVLAKVRFMEDFLGHRIFKATPAMPVKIAGLSKVPNFGEQVVQTKTEREAKNQVNKINIKKGAMDVFEASEAIKSGQLKQLPIVLKVDTQGSLEAIKNTIEQFDENGVKVKIVTAGVGPINENDVNMAIASSAVIIGFRVNAFSVTEDLLREKNIKVKNYDIIYRLFEDIQEILKGLIEPEYEEVIIGKLEVLKVFHKTSDRKLIGGRVVDGKIIINEKVKIIHSGDVIGKGKIISLQIEKNQVTEIKKGQECGLAVATKTIVKSGDLIEQYKLEEIVVKK